MGLDLALGGLVLLAAIRGWFKGFVMQAVRLSGLVACVYAADPIRDQVRPRVLAVPLGHAARADRPAALVDLGGRGLRRPGRAGQPDRQALPPAALRPGRAEPRATSSPARCSARRRGFSWPRSCSRGVQKYAIGYLKLDPAGQGADRGFAGARPGGPVSIRRTRSGPCPPSSSSWPASSEAA